MATNLWSNNIGNAITSAANHIQNPVSTTNPWSNNIGNAAKSVASPTVTANQPDYKSLLDQMNQQYQNLLNAQKQPNYDIAGLLKQYQAPTPVDNSGLIKEQYSGALQQLKDAIAASKAKLPSVYNQQRTQANVTGALGALGDQERLASQGLANSGEAESSRIARQTGVGNVVNALNLQQNQANADLDTQLNNGIYQNQTDLASALAQNNTNMYNQQAQQYQNNISNILAALGLQNTINNDTFNQGITEAGVTGTYNGNKTQDALNADRNYALNEAGLTGVYNGKKTLEAQNQAYNQNMTTKQYNADQAQQKLDNLYRQQAFNYQKSRDAVSDNQWQKQMNLDLRKQSYSEAQQSIENSLAQKRISQDDAAQALQWARFNAEQDPNSIDNQLKKSNLDANTYAKNTSVLNDTIQRLDSLYTYKDANGVPTRNPNFNDIQLRNAIIGLNLSDDQTDTLLLRYGLKIN